MGVLYLVRRTFLAAAKQRSWLVVLLLAVGFAGILFRPIAAFFAVGMLFSAVPIRFGLAGGAGLLAGAVCAATMYVCIEYVHPFVGLVPGFLLFGMVLAQGSGVATWLSTPVPQFLGKISYSLYLVHPFALFPLQMLGARLAAAVSIPGCCGGASSCSASPSRWWRAR